MAMATSWPVAGRRLAARVAPWRRAPGVRARALSSRAAAAPAGVLLWRDVEFSASSGLKLDVFAPDASALPFPRDRLPVLVWAHGGAFRSGSKEAAGEFAARCARDHGIVAVPVSYGLVPSVAWPRPALDVREALGWVRGRIARFGGDPGAVFVGGHSAGAFLAMHAGLSLSDDRDSVRGIVGVSGVYDLQFLASVMPGGSTVLLDALLGLGPHRAGDERRGRALRIAASQQLFRFRGPVQLLLAEQELPRLRADAAAVFNSARSGRCIIAQVPECNHFNVMRSPATAGAVAAFVHGTLQSQSTS